MPDRGGAHAGVRVAQAAEPIGIVAEQVRIDRADPNPLPLGEGEELAVVVDGVPGNVQGDARAAARQPVDECGIGDALVDVTRGARPGVDVEPRAGVAVPPGRRLDLQLLQAPDDGLPRPSGAV